MSSKNDELQGTTTSIQNSETSLQRNALLAKREVIQPGLKDVVPQIVACFIVHGIVIPAGVNMAYSTVLIHGLKSDNDIISNINEHQVSWIASLVTISVPLGSILSGPLMDKFGRKMICFFSCIPCIISWILLINATSITMIYASRVIAGIGSGLSSVGLVYMAEISHPHFRSVFLCFNSIYVAFGILAVCCLGAFLDWHSLAIIFLVMNCITFCSLFYLPESPLWLICFGNEKSLDKRMRKVDENLKKLNPRESIYNQERERIKDIGERQASLKKKNLNVRESVCHYLKQLSRPEAYKPIIILVVILSLQQLSGAYVVIFYAISVFQEIGGSFGGGLDEFGALILLGLIRFIMSIATAHLSKTYGRRTLCLASGIGMSFSMFFSAMYLYITSFQDNGFTEVLLSQKWLLLMIMLLYVCTSSVGFLVIPWTLIGELLPTSIRGFFCGLIVSVAYLVMFGVIKGYPYVLKAIGAQNVFFIFSVTSVLATFYVYFFLPETKGKSLSEIEHYFARNRKFINFDSV